MSDPLSPTVSFADFQLFAARTIPPARWTAEIEIRRAVSSLYYGLFHRLAEAGAGLFGAGGQALQNKIVRSYGHTDMREVCKDYLRWAPTQIPRKLVDIVTVLPDPKLLFVAQAFVELQEARHRADYDLRTTLTQQEGVELVRLATRAHSNFAAVEHNPETTVFLTALLFANRWTRRD